MQRQCLALALCLCSVFLPRPLSAQDTDQIRFYIGPRLGLRWFTSDRIGPAEIEVNYDSFGVIMGLNFGKHFGLEVSVDHVESSLGEPGSDKKIGEYSIWSAILQARVRYPVVNRKLTPYVVAGVGRALTDFNDPTPTNIGFLFEAEKTSPIGSLGGGLEYFVANNISIGAEARFLPLSAKVGQQDVGIDDAALHSFFFTIGMRSHFPEAKVAPGR